MGLIVLPWDGLVTVPWFPGASAWPIARPFTGGEEREGGGGPAWLCVYVCVYVCGCVCGGVCVAGCVFVSHDVCVYVCEFLAHPDDAVM